MNTSLKSCFQNIILTTYNHICVFLLDIAFLEILGALGGMVVEVSFQCGCPVFTPLQFGELMLIFCSSNLCVSTTCPRRVQVSWTEQNIQSNHRTILDQNLFSKRVLIHLLDTRANSSLSKFP